MKHREIKKNSKIFVAILFLLFTSCKKNDLTQPVEIPFEISMESFQANKLEKSNFRFTINEGTINISSIDFYGKRETGEDYYFTTVFDSTLRAEMQTGKMNQKLAFDFPQGIYSTMELTFYIGTEKDKSIILNGSYHHGNSSYIPILFEYKLIDKIAVQITDTAMKKQIVLQKDVPTKAKIIFKTPSLFQFVNYKMIQDAETVNIDGTATILINENTNQEIFNLLASRIDNSMKILFIK